MEASAKHIVIACDYCHSPYRILNHYSGRHVTCNKCRRKFPATMKSIKQPSPEEDAVFLCRLALYYGLITEIQLEEAFTEYSKQQHRGMTPNIEKILMEYGGITKDTLNLVNDIKANWDLRLAEKQFADEAVKRKFITREQARKALIKQAQHFYHHRKINLLCDILTESGEMTPVQCEMIFDGTKPPVHHHQPPPTNQKQAFVPTIRQDHHPDIALPPKDEPESVQPRPEVSHPSPHETTYQEPLKKNTERIVETPVIKNEVQDRPPEAQKPAPVPPPPSVEDNSVQMPLKPSAASIQPKTAGDSTIVNVSPPEPSDTAIEPDNTQAPSAEDIQFDISRLRPKTTDVPKTIEEEPETPYLDDKNIDTDIDTDSEPDDYDDRQMGPRVVMVNGLELIIARDGLLAQLRVPEGADPTMVTVENIKLVLIEEDITFGVVEDALIRGFLNSKIFREKPFKIAEGTPPQPGRNAEVKYHFETDYLKVGKVTESGGIDFKSRGEIPFVEEGTLLAEITPALPGRTGMDIFGRELPVPAVRDLTLKCEAGTRLSEDRLKVYASVSGQPKLNFGDKLYVLSELVIPGDVCFKTGHIDFAGNVTIQGTVQSDFTVKGANIKANEVLSANIIAKGNVDVKNGISSANIDAQGDVHAKFFNKTTVKAYGNVIADKEIIDCTIQCSGACVLETGTIITSIIAAKQGISAREIGTETSKPCHLKIGVDDHILTEIGVIDEQITHYKKHVVELEKTIQDFHDRQKNIHKDIADLAQIQDRSQIELKELRQQLESNPPPDKLKEINGKIEGVENTIRHADKSINDSFDIQDKLTDDIEGMKENIAEFNEKISDLTLQRKDMVKWAQQIKTVAYIRTKGAIYNGTFIAGINSSRVLRETMRSAQIFEARVPDAPEGWEIRIG